MGELRTCPVTGQVVLVDGAVLDHPHPAPPPPAPCPWCTPSEPPIQALAGVTARAHPHPVLRVERDVTVHTVDGHVRREALGAHEILAGDHVGDEVSCLRLAQARIRDLRGDRRLRGFRLARRHAPGHHRVWSLWALPFEGAPGAPARWRDRELLSGERVIAEEAGAVGILAWAPRVPFETWVLARSGGSGFEDGDPTAVARLGDHLAARLSRVLGGAAVDLFVCDGEGWRIELLPVLPDGGLFARATGIPRHGGVPERVAEYLRQAEEPP